MVAYGCLKLLVSFQKGKVQEVDTLIEPEVKETKVAVVEKQPVVVETKVEEKKPEPVVEEINIELQIQVLAQPAMDLSPTVNLHHL